MKITLGRKIIAGFIACALVLMSVAIFTFKNSEKFVASNTLVNHTSQVLSELQQILVNITNAETGTRGYVITGDDSFLESYSGANLKTIEHLNKVRVLTRDNLTQQKNIEELAQLIKARVATLDRCIELRKNSFEAAKLFIEQGEGKRLQQNITQTIDLATAIENGLLAQRKQASIEDASNFNLVFILFLTLIASILIVVYNIISNNNKALKNSEEDNAAKNWLLTGNSELKEKLIGDRSVGELANNTISFLCDYLKANIGAVYLFNEQDRTLTLGGQYAFSSPSETTEQFRLNEGVIGQAAWEQKQISLNDISEGQIRISSSIIDATPKHLLITPFLLDGKTVGVIEIGKLTDFSETEKEFINVSMNSIAISVNTLQQAKEKEKRAAELFIANKELLFQSDEKEKRAAELSIANKELLFQSDEKEKRAAELIVANEELVFQSDEKEKRAAELIIANKELVFQSDEKGKRAAELIIANEELVFQSEEKGKRAAELIIANEELVFQSNEKEKRAAELVIANKELIFQSDEKEKRAAELVIANAELVFQSDEKEKRAAELVIANKELVFQNEEKEKRAAELVLTNQELAFQAEELQAQQEELRQMNEELEEQTQNLKQQQEELQMTNEELEEQTQSLEVKNSEVEAAKNDIELKTKQLEISSKYKSEFLANMSHELRTPLNSLLILSKDLSENKKQNLDAIQVESAEIIYKSGHDLLILINEVLDLSKIEAGKMSIDIERVSLSNFIDNLIRNFKHQADKKGLKLISKLEGSLPEFIRTDSQRLSQILKNLLSNAIKFTDKGSVSLIVKRKSDNTLVISVIDTGIGIQQDKQLAIFEAFQQADGGTARKYGGTGLGLSISRELAKLLGAEIKVSSIINKGSTFSMTIPIELSGESETANTVVPEIVQYQPRKVEDTRYLNYPSIDDDRNTLHPGDKVVLLVEDDLKFAAILYNLAKHKGFKCLAASSGEDGLALALKFKPQAIILDMGLPGINGHQVLAELKANPVVRHIPVHIISGNERSLGPIREGAVEYLMKPIEKKDLEAAFNRIETFVNRKIKNLLIIEDNENSRKAMKILIGEEDVKCFEAETGKQALDLYSKNQIDCIILDIGLPDISGFELIHKFKDLKDHKIPPIIVYTGKELTKEENNELQKYSESIIIKGVKSEERLLDETALFLHRTIKNMPESKQIIINNLHDQEALFHGKKILVVDDDSRNVFALSKVLIERGMEIIKAENGKVALEMLDANPDINLVLMDIMMPEMDGYEAMRRIRFQVKYRNLPVIALTAKAMKDDRQKCIDAGANDYITKPIDVEMLLSLMRIWLSK